MGAILRLYRGYVGLYKVLQGLYRDAGKNGSHYLGFSVSWNPVE